MTMLAPWLLLGFASANESADCPKRYEDQEIVGMGGRAMDDFANLDASGFNANRDQILAAMDCLSEPLTTTAASSYFRIRALDAFLKRAPDDLQSNANAMAHIDPAPPPTSVTPRGHPVRNAWETARNNGPGEIELLPVPAGGRLRIDGRDTLERPLERPTIVQFVERTGELKWTRLLQPGETVPEYDAVGEEARSAYENAVIIKAPRRPVERPLITGLLAAGAIGTYGASLATHQQFDKLGNDDRDDLESRRRTTNALVGTSAGLGVLAVGFGTWTVLTW